MFSLIRSNCKLHIFIIFVWSQKMFRCNNSDRTRLTKGWVHSYLLYVYEIKEFIISSFCLIIGWLFHNMFTIKRSLQFNSHNQIFVFLFKLNFLLQFFSQSFQAIRYFGTIIPGKHGKQNSEYNNIDSLFNILVGSFYPFLYVNWLVVSHHIHD